MGVAGIDTSQHQKLDNARGIVYSGLPSLYTGARVDNLGCAEFEISTAKTIYEGLAIGSNAGEKFFS